MGENPYFSIDFYKVKMGFSLIAIPSFLISVCITGTIITEALLLSTGMYVRYSAYIV